MVTLGTLNLDDMQEEGKRLKGDDRGSFLDQFVPLQEKGKRILRIFPPVEGGKLYQYNRFHNINGRKVTCPKPLVNGKWDRNTPCVICDYYSNLWRQKDKAAAMGDKVKENELLEEARSLKPNERYYYNVLIRSLISEEGEVQTNVGPRIWSVGKQIHHKIIRAFMGDDDTPALGDVTHIKNGFDFILDKKLKGDYPDYGESTFEKEPKPLGTAEEIEEWVKNLYDLSKFRNVKDADYLEKQLAIHKGLIADDTEGGFNEDEFNAKFTSSTTVPVTADVVSETTETTTETTTEVAASESSEDTSIDNDDFLNDLKEFEQE